MVPYMLKILIFMLVHVDFSKIKCTEKSHKQINDHNYIMKYCIYMLQIKKIFVI